MGDVIYTVPRSSRVPRAVVSARPLLIISCLCWLIILAACVNADKRAISSKHARYQSPSGEAVTIVCRDDASAVPLEGIVIRGLSRAGVPSLADFECGPQHDVSWITLFSGNSPATFPLPANAWWLLQIAVTGYEPERLYLADGRAPALISVDLHPKMPLRLDLGQIDGYSVVGVRIESVIADETCALCVDRDALIDLDVNGRWATGESVPAGDYNVFVGLQRSYPEVDPAAGPVWLGPVPLAIIPGQSVHALESSLRDALREYMCRVTLSIVSSGDGRDGTQTIDGVIDQFLGRSRTASSVRVRLRRDFGRTDRNQEWHSNAVHVPLGRYVLRVPDLDIAREFVVDALTSEIVVSAPASGATELSVVLRDSQHASHVLEARYLGDEWWNSDGVRVETTTLGENAGQFLATVRRGYYDCIVWGPDGLHCARFGVNANASADVVMPCICSRDQVVIMPVDAESGASLADVCWLSRNLRLTDSEGRFVPFDIQVAPEDGTATIFLTNEVRTAPRLVGDCNGMAVSLDHDPGDCRPYLLRVHR